MLNPHASSKVPTSLAGAQKPMAKDLVPAGKSLSPQEVERICKAFIRLLQAPVHEGDANAQR
jgi:hypothetical protein